jgi:hypothetical protein
MRWRSRGATLAAAGASGIATRATAGIAATLARRGAAAGRRSSRPLLIQVAHSGRCLLGCGPGRIHGRRRPLRSGTGRRGLGRTTCGWRHRRGRSRRSRTSRGRRSRRRRLSRTACRRRCRGLGRTCCRGRGHSGRRGRSLSRRDRRRTLGRGCMPARGGLLLTPGRSIGSPFPRARRGRCFRSLCFAGSRRFRGARPSGGSGRGRCRGDRRSLRRSSDRRHWCRRGCRRGRGRGRPVLEIRHPRRRSCRNRRDPRGSGRSCCCRTAATLDPLHELHDLIAHLGIERAKLILHVNAMIAA